MVRNLKPLQEKYLAATAAEVSFNQQQAADTSKSMQNAVSSARSGILIGLVVAILAAAAVSVVVMRSITRPLASAVDLVEYVTQGDLSHKTNVTSQDELGQMLMALNGMIDNLQAAADVATRIAEGDLTVQPKVLSEKDVFGNALVRMLDNLRKTVQRRKVRVVQRRPRQRRNELHGAAAFPRLHRTGLFRQRVHQFH